MHALGQQLGAQLRAGDLVLLVLPSAPVKQRSHAVSATGLRARPGDQS